MASADKREQILSRLAELMTESYIGAKTVARNRGLLSEDVKPAIAIMDGDERVRLSGDGQGRGNNGRQAMLPQLVTMQPEIFTIPEVKKPKNIGLGEEVNDLRITLIRVIAQDPVLLDIIGANGSIAYMGMVSDLKSGMNLDGQTRLDIAFTYVLDPYGPIN